MHFLTKVAQFYRITDRMSLAAAIPGRDYPPANIAAWMKECRKLGRDDLAQKIQDQWYKIFDNALEKYPAVRQNFAAATKIGSNSMKKNVFGGMEFSEWINSNANLTPPQKQAVKVAQDVSGIPAGTPAIAIPKDDESPDDWVIAAEKTKEALATAEQSFVDVNELVTYLKNEINSLSGKIQRYGGSSPKLNKDGSPSAYSQRVPKWQAQLKLYQEKLAETEEKIKAAEKNLADGKKAYNTAPVTTVAFEDKVQQRVVQLTMRLGGIESEKAEIMKELEQLGKQLQKASAAFEVNALSLDEAFSKILSAFSKAWRFLFRKADGILSASESLLDFTTLKTVK